MTTLSGKWAVHFKTLGIIECHPDLLGAAKAVAEKSNDPTDFDFYNLQEPGDAVIAHSIAASLEKLVLTSQGRSEK